MLTLKLAFRNIIGRGVMTWLNVFVLSLAFVAIIWLQGLMEGMYRQGLNNMIEVELGGGQFWQHNYDPFDPLKLDESHSPIPPALNQAIEKGEAVPILITIGAIFPEGRVQTALLKGILPQQKILNFPSSTLQTEDDEYIPALIGTRMAKSANLKPGDYVTVRWRDKYGAFDAADVKIVHIMNTTVPSIDNGQIWLPIDKLQHMTSMPGEATLITLNQNLASIPQANELWSYKSRDFLLKDFNDMIKAKKFGSSFFYILILLMALLAIFDTQVLSIFRRRKEMGTMMALGMTRSRVIQLFTLEGAMHGVLALLVGAVYGTPIMIFSCKKGLPLPEAMSDFGVAISNTLNSHITFGLLATSTILVMLTVVIVSFLPTRKIANLKPTDALRGKFK